MRQPPATQKRSPRHRQLTVSAGWQRFVDETPAPPELLSQGQRRQLSDAARLAYNEGPAQPPFPAAGRRDPGQPQGHHRGALAVLPQPQRRLRLMRLILSGPPPEPRIVLPGPVLAPEADADLWCQILRHLTRPGNIHGSVRRRSRRRTRTLASGAGGDAQQALLLQRPMRAVGVVMVGVYSPRTRRRCRSPVVSIRSRHSRRALASQRSASRRRTMSRCHRKMVPG